MPFAVVRRLRLLLAVLMLLTGVLGQLGHATAHGSDPDPAAAWLAALQAERDWLAGAETERAGASVQVFGAEGHHRHGDGPAHQHDGPDVLVAEHAHGMAFLLPAASDVPRCAQGASPAWFLSAHPAGARPGHPDRPPRNGAPLA